MIQHILQQLSYLGHSIKNNVTGYFLVGRRNKPHKPGNRPHSAFVPTLSAASLIANVALERAILNAHATSHSSQSVNDREYKSVRFCFDTGMFVLMLSTSEKSISAYTIAAPCSVVDKTWPHGVTTVEWPHA